jgi:hypothetical protein
VGSNYNYDLMQEKSRSGSHPIPKSRQLSSAFEFRSKLFPMGLRAHKTRSHRLGTIASRNPGRSRVRDLNRLVLRVGDLVYDLDVNHVTINNSDAFILLSALGGIVIHGSVFTIPSRIARVNWVWIIVLN